MVKFNTVILRFNKKGEKTGWTYIEISAAQADKIKKNCKKSFRVKGKLDNLSIKSVALIPMGKGDFIMALNAGMRKKIKKQQGESLAVQLEEDTSAFIFNPDLMACLKDDKTALKQFRSMPPSHQKYFSKWIDSAKSDSTRAKRIAMTLNAMINKLNYGEMLRAEKGKRG